MFNNNCPKHGCSNKQKMRQVTKNFIFFYYSFNFNQNIYFINTYFYSLIKLQSEKLMKSLSNDEILNKKFNKNLQKLDKFQK